MAFCEVGSRPLSQDPRLGTLPMCPQVPGLSAAYQQLRRGFGDCRDGIETGGGHKPHAARPVVLAQGPALRSQQPLLLRQDHQVPLLEGQEGNVTWNSKSHTQGQRSRRLPGALQKLGLLAFPGFSCFEK